MKSTEGVGGRCRFAVPRARELSGEDMAWIDAMNEATRMAHFDCVTAAGTWRESEERQRQIMRMRRSCPQAVVERGRRSLDLVEVKGRDAQPYFGRLEPAEIEVFAQWRVPSSNVRCMLARAIVGDVLRRVLRQQPWKGMCIELQLGEWNGGEFLTREVWTRRGGRVDFGAELAVLIVGGSAGGTWFEWGTMFEVLGCGAELLVGMSRASWPLPAEEVAGARVAWTLGPGGGWRTTLSLVRKG